MSSEPTLDVLYRGEIRLNTPVTKAIVEPDCSLGSGWSVVDLCCGLGGISAAAQQLGSKIVAGVDLSSTGLETFANAFPDATPVNGSVTSIKVSAKCATIVKAAKATGRTLIVSGPPCQGFSVAGPREKHDPRNRVLAAVVKLIVELQPDAALIENVAALLTKRHRGHLHRFKTKLRDGGYSVELFELDASEYGVPQRRRRMVCFASKRDLNREFLQEALDAYKTDAPSVEEALAGLQPPPVYPGPGNWIELDVFNHMAMRHSPAVQEKISKLKPGTGPMSYRRLHPQKVSRTLISGNRAPPAHFAEPRSITVREAARLQGFPDDFEIKGTFSKQMLHVTNAVPPPLARAALHALFCSWEQSL